MAYAFGLDNLDTYALDTYAMDTYGLDTYGFDTLWICCFDVSSRVGPR